MSVETLIKDVVGKGMSSIASFNRGRMGEPDIPNPYVEGIHAPMREELTLTELSVTGEIPPELDGRYVRNGANPMEPPHAASHHWFVGDAMLHGVRLRDGKAEWYRNRWVRSKAVADALGEPVPPGRRNPQFDSPNTNVIGHDGRIWALVEAGGMPAEIGPELTTVAHNPWDDTLSTSFSAHPHLDPATGELHAICYDATDPTTVWHVVVGTDAKVRREEPIRVAGGPSIHDCAITEDYILVFDLPVTLSFKTLLKGYAFPYRWDPQHRARVGLCPKAGSGRDTIWCDVDPCYVFHPANARQMADGKVVVDVVAHDSMFARRYAGPDSRAAKLERWTIDPDAKTVRRETLSDRNQEFPRYDERRTTADYRYIYSQALPNNALLDGSRAETVLLRQDLETGKTATHDFGKGRFPGEFVFVPRGQTDGEDDGWLIGFVIAPDAGRTDLAILNADDFDGEPQALIHLPHRIPTGFHGNWIADG
ncbi:MAG: carotenoid oxygenase family protein [Pacificimonas sp.]